MALKKVRIIKVCPKLPNHNHSFLKVIALGVIDVACKRLFTFVNYKDLGISEGCSFTGASSYLEGHLLKMASA